MPLDDTPHFEHALFMVQRCESFGDEQRASVEQTVFRKPDQEYRSALIPERRIKREAVRAPSDLDG